jgi:hypothetical protein
MSELPNVIQRALSHDLATHPRCGEIQFEVGPPPDYSRLLAMAASLGRSTEELDFVGGLALSLGGRRVLEIGVLNSPESGEMVRVASEVQDVVLQDLLVVWPECPGHTHPQEPREVMGKAAWVCPVTGQVAAEIGELEPS